MIRSEKNCTLKLGVKKKFDPEGKTIAPPRIKWSAPYLHVHVGSPFHLRVSNAGMVRVTGPGLENGLRLPGQDEFVVDLKDVSPGDVTVEIGGPSRRLFI